MGSGRVHDPQRLLAAALIASCALSLRSAVEAQCVRYVVDVIPGPNCTFSSSSSVGLGINSAGEICGSWYDCNQYFHPAIWLGQGPWQSFPLPPGIAGAAPRGVNSARHCAAIIPGSPNPDLYRGAFIDFPNGTMTILPNVPGANYMEALAINDSDVICGTSNNTSHGPLHAFIWQNGQTIVLNLPFGTDSGANGISDSGFVTGWMGAAPQIDAHAYLWSGGKTLDLGPGLAGALGADARSVSNTGAVCGFNFFMDPDPKVIYRKRACLWTDGRVIDLGTLPGCLHSRAFALNDSNIVIGYCDNYPYGGLQHNPTFVWSDGVMRDLNDLIPASLHLHIDSVLSINNAGQITGEADVLEGPNHVDQVAVRLTPIPPIPGDYNCDYVVNVQDLLGVLTHWGPNGGNGPADFDLNGTVNVDDLLTVILHWS